jgi:hypothetical protein
VFPFLTCYYGNGGTKVSKKAERRLSLSSTLKLDQAPVVTVIGKAFWDIGHAPKDQSNRRKNLPGDAAWEIHPVMRLEYDSD